MTDSDLDTLLASTTWNVFVEHILGRILAEHLDDGSAHALLSSVLKGVFARGANAALDEHEREARDSTTPTLH